MLLEVEFAYAGASALNYFENLEGINFNIFIRLRGLGLGEPSQLLPRPNVFVRFGDIIGIFQAYLWTTMVTSKDDNIVSSHFVYGS